MDHLILISTTLREQFPDLESDELHSLAEHVIGEIEFQVGQQLSEGLDGDQLAEFEALVDVGNDQGINAWLERNRPDYPRTVMRIRDAVLAETLRIVHARSGASETESSVEGNEHDENTALRDWPAVEAYVSDRYADVARRDDNLMITLKNGHGRTRTVLVNAPNDKWIELEAVVGKNLDVHDVHTALTAAYRYVGIGIALSGPHLLVRSAVSYAGATGESLRSAIDLVAGTADGSMEALAEHGSDEAAR